MTRRLVLGVALLSGCTWSNSLYQARLLSGNAEQAERDLRPAEARQIWGQVVVKADSAYARDPRGSRGAEALWLSGHASVRDDDCGRAIPRLQGAMTAGARAPWRQQLLFELASCEEPLGGPTAASLYTTLIASSSDPVILRRARLRLGHTLVMREDWQGALDALAEDDTLPARVDRATALANIGRADEALAELSRPMATADTAIRWLDFVELFATRNTAATDALLARLLEFPTFSVETRSRWLLEAARAALSFDPAAADRRLHVLAARPSGVAVNEGRLLKNQLTLRRAVTPAALRLAIDSLPGGDIADEGVGARQVVERTRIARALLKENDMVAPGAPAGDLAMIGLSALAQDSLRSPGLGAWFLARLEQQWPGSPYLGKALMARAALEPDSTDAILARARRLTANPYVAAANGEVAGMVRVTQLEDSLGRFVDRMWAIRPARP